MVMKIHVVDFSVITPCSDVIGYQCLGGSCCLKHVGILPHYYSVITWDGCSMALWNIGILLHHYPVS